MASVPGDFLRNLDADNAANAARLPALTAVSNQGTPAASGSPGTPSAAPAQQPGAASPGALAGLYGLVKPIDDTVSSMFAPTRAAMADERAYAGQGNYLAAAGAGMRAAGGVALGTLGSAGLVAASPFIGAAKIGSNVLQGLVGASPASAAPAAPVAAPAASQSSRLDASSGDPLTQGPAGPYRTHVDKSGDTTTTTMYAVGPDPLAGQGMPAARVTPEAVAGGLRAQSAEAPSNNDGLVSALASLPRHEFYKMVASLSPLAAQNAPTTQAQQQMLDLVKLQDRISQSKTASDAEKVRQNAAVDQLINRRKGIVSAGANPYYLPPGGMPE